MIAISVCEPLSAHDSHPKDYNLSFPREEQWLFREHVVDEDLPPTRLCASKEVHKTEGCIECPFGPAYDIVAFLRHMHLVIDIENPRDTLRAAKLGGIPVEAFSWRRRYNIGTGRL